MERDKQAQSEEQTSHREAVVAQSFQSWGCSGRCLSACGSFCCALTVSFWDHCRLLVSGTSLAQPSVCVPALEQEARLNLLNGTLRGKQFRAAGESGWQVRGDAGWSEVQGDVRRREVRGGVGRKDISGSEDAGMGMVSAYGAKEGQGVGAEPL